MANLTERIDVKCPHHFLMRHTERYFAVHRRDQTPGTFGLTVDMSRVGLPGKVQARHDVRMSYRILKDAAGHDVIDLTWDPDDRFVPSFAGSLSGERRDDGYSGLSLAGTYEAPFGAIGAMFDAVLGRRIAAATARALLEDVKRFVESDYQTALSTSLAESPKE